MQIILLLYSLHLVLCSYLDYPRVHFAGEFRVDSTVINNFRCNFRMDHDIPYNDPPEMHDYGSNSFLFYNAVVTGMVRVNGSLIENSEGDRLFGQEIVTNIDRPFAKLVDLDVDCQMHSTIYGMNFGIRNAEGKLLLYGNWTPCVIANFLWYQLTCFTDVDKCLLEYSPSGESFSAQSTTTLTNIKWASDADLTPFLSTLKEKLTESKQDHLAIRITLHSFKYTGNRAGLGWVEGVIGIPNTDDALCVPGQRIMHQVSGSQPKGLNYDICQNCTYGGKNISQGSIWLGPTPFKVQVESGGSAARVSVDFSSTVVMDNYRNIRDIKKLELAVYDESQNFKVIGEFKNYTDKATYTVKSGIYDFFVDDGDIVPLLQDNPMVVIQTTCAEADPDEVYNSQPGKPVSIVSQNGTQTICTAPIATVLLKEHEYFIRPKGYYVGRLDAHKKSSDQQQVYITRYGKIPTDNLTLTVNSMLNPEMATPVPAIPCDGVVGKFKDYDRENGIATFEFRKGAHIPELRIYGQPMCKGDDRITIPIDGQVYFFYYSINGHEDQAFQRIQTVYLAHSDVNYTRLYTWLRDVSPIFTQYARLTPMMRTILDLSNYQDVTKPHNRDLLRKNLVLDFYDPAYMPTTRDLSPVKRAMILEWLSNPLYDNQCQLHKVIGQSEKTGGRMFNYNLRKTEGRPNILPERCNNTKEILFDGASHLHDPSFLSPFNVSKDNKCYHIKRAANDSSEENVTTVILEILKERPLLSYSRKSHLRGFADTTGDVELVCNKSSVVRQLQTALRLEWSTLPAYLTTLYSIPHDCNVEIYDLIRLIVMQEMFHFALVGNLLIALGVVPKIDFPTFAPSYPGPLPGCVLPALNVTLEKLSLKHIHDVLMMIELPMLTEVIDNKNYEYVFTIGAFYEEIRSCINDLNDTIFDASTENLQVKWRLWDANSFIGNLSAITDKDSAIAAIDTIVSQGEGADTLNPKDISEKTYAHFFKFEEIYCGRHIKQVSNSTYSYSGPQIFFNPGGIAPMRSNPNTRNLPQDTLCYTESRTFHIAYRNFLRKLQEVFNGKAGGKPNDIFVAVELMEALQLNAKRLMWIDFDGTQTCGPVWDYEFGS